MPKEGFFKLNDDKKEKIMDAAREEFIKKSYEDASINKIVKDSNISRGSFYCYFEDKRDIFIYLLQNEIDSFINNCIYENDSKKKIDFFELFLKFFKSIITICEQDAGRELIKNTLSNIKMEFEKDLFNHANKDLYFRLKDRVSGLDNIGYKNEKELVDIYDMCLHCVIEALYCTIFKQESSKEQLKRLKFKLEIIKKGTKREEKK